MRLFSFDSPIKSFGGNMLKLRDHQHTVRYLYLYLGEHRQNANCVSACLHSFQFVCSLLNTKKPPNYSKPCIQAHNSQYEHRTYSDNCNSKKKFPSLVVVFVIVFSRCMHFIYAIYWPTLKFNLWMVHPIFNCSIFVNFN